MNTAQPHRINPIVFAFYAVGVMAAVAGINGVLEHGVDKRVLVWVFHVLLWYSGGEIAARLLVSN